MQTLQVVQTIRWIRSLFSDELQTALFTLNLFRVTQPAKDNDPNTVSAYLKATHELTRITEVITQNSDAVQVLTVFNLEPLTNKAFGTDLAIQVATQGARSIRDVIHELYLPWRIMINCAAPIERLTLPEELTVSETPESVITIVLHFREAEAHGLEKLALALKSLNSAYLSIAKIYGLEDTAGHLQILKIESGSAVRVDCKGLGLAVKHLKEFFIEAWHKFRHKRTEEIIEKNRAVLSTVSAVQQIESSVQSGSMSREQGELLKRSTLEDTLGLFGAGALIIEIPQEETLDNTKLLREFGTKLLMAPGESRKEQVNVSLDDDSSIETAVTIVAATEESTPTNRSTKKTGIRKSSKKSRKRK